MRNFHGIALVWTQTYSEIFKSVLVQLQLPYFFDQLCNRSYLKQNLVASSEFVLTRFHRIKDIFCRKHVSYCPFVWMRYARTLNNKIFRLQERFRIIYDEKHSFIQCFFDRGRSVSIQTPNLQFFASEIIKNSNGITPNVLAKILISNAPCKLLSTL